MDYTDPSKNIQSTFKEHGRRGKNRKQMKFQRHSGNLHERMIQIKCKKKPSSKENFHSKKGCVGRWVGVYVSVTHMSYRKHLRIIIIS